jgi:hypothetical protein
MAKPGLQPVTTSSTFQGWLDRTNEMVAIFQSEAITASVVGDTTGSVLNPVSATIIGSFSANNAVVNDLLRTDTISPKIGSSSIMINAQITANTALQTAAIFRSTQGARTTYASASSNWLVGYENVSTNSFVIDNGVGATKFRLTTDGNLFVSGTLNASQFNGNATTATRLATPVAINGTSFDGSAAITITATTPQPLIRGTYLVGNNFNGSASTTWGVDATSNNVNEKVVVRDSSGNFSATTITANLTGNVTGNVTGNITGNAATATKLVASRNINGVGFDGTENITIPINTTNNTDDTSGYLVFTLGASGNQNTHTVNGVRINPLTRTISAINFNSTSDITMKENIRPIENAIEKVKRISGVHFSWKDNGVNSIGVIAQEIEKVFPELVQEMDGVKSVSYGNLIAVLIEAIKELDKRTKKS